MERGDLVLDFKKSLNLISVSLYSISELVIIHKAGRPKHQ